MDISIIIPNYKSQDCLPRCLDSLRKGIDPEAVKYEIILINNDEVPITTVLTDNTIAIINNPINNGFAGACNKGAAAAQGRILLFLNPDTELISGTITDLISTFDDEKVGVVSSQLILSSGDVQPWSAGCEITLPEILLNNFGFIRSKSFWKKNPKNNPAWVSGAALTIRKKFFQELAGFDENFFMYFEDVDLCKRAREASKTILILPSVKFLHLGGHSCASSAQQKKHYYASQDYYFKKHFGLFSLFLLRLIRGLVLSLKRNV